MKTRKLLLTALSMMLVATSAFAFSSCAQFQGEKGDKGDKGAQGQQGAAGQAGVGISGIAYDANGNLVVSFTDGTSQTLEAPAKHEHTYGDWTAYGNNLSFRVCDCGAVECKIVEEQAGGGDAEQAPGSDAEQAPGSDAEQAPGSDAEQAPGTSEEAPRDPTVDSLG